MSNIFEQASRLQLRFGSPKGDLTAEDLWVLPLTSSIYKPNLDDIARSLFRQLKSGDDVSFVTTSQKSDPKLQLSFDVVKHIIDVRLAENAAALQAKANAERKQKILGLIAEKEDGKLASMSEEDLRAMLVGL